LALYEKGALSRGLYRGIFVGYLAAMCQGTLDNGKLALNGLIATVACNPFSILQVHKQAFHNSQTKSYSQILSEVGLARMFTLGLIPTLARNVLVCAGFIPSFIGNT
jgi:hypothetical protein